VPAGDKVGIATHNTCNQQQFTAYIQAGLGITGKQFIPISFSVPHAQHVHTTRRRCTHHELPTATCDDVQLAATVSLPVSQQIQHVLFVTSRAAAVAKYCGEHVCLSVCLSVSLTARISPEQHAPSLSIFLCMLCCLWPWLGPPPAGWRNPKGKGQFWGFSSPVTMHCNAFAAKEIGREWVMGVRRLDYKLNDKLTLYKRPSLKTDPAGLLEILTQQTSSYSFGFVYVTDFTCTAIMQKVLMFIIYLICLILSFDST